MTIREFVPEQLRSRYAVKFFAVALLVVLVVGLSGTAMVLKVSDDLREEQLQTVERNAELEANQLGNWFTGEQEFVRALSMNQDANPTDPAATREMLRSEVQRRDGELANLHIVERAERQPSNGTTEPIVASSDPNLEGKPLGETDIYWGETPEETEIQFAFEGSDDILVSWVYLADDTMSVAIASPTPDGEHVLVAEYRPSTHIAEAINIIEGSNTVVLGGVSAFVMFEDDSPNEFRRYKGAQNATEVGRKILARESTSTIISGSNMDEDEVRGYHSVPAEGVDWVVVKEVPRSSALALTKQVQSDLAILLGVVFLGFVVTAGMIQYGPINSIKRLSRQANAIAKGDLSVDIGDTNRTDEFGQLTESFQNTRGYIETITRQMEALSRQRFDAEVLEEEIPGPVGEAMDNMQRDLQRYITELQTERERYSTLVEQSNDGVVVVQGGTLTFVNKRFVEMTGYDREALRSMGPRELLPAENREAVVEDLPMLCSESSIATFDPVTQYRAEIETKGGERRTVELSAAAIEHFGEPAALVNVRDITEHERREQRLEVFNRVLRHNLRSDLQVVSLGLDSVDPGACSEPDHIHMAKNRLDDLLSTADTARRIERALESFEVGHCDLREVLDPLVDRAGKEFPDGTLDSFEGTATVEAANVLDSAIWELLENAFQHTGPEPHVDIELDVHEEVAVLEISDDGPGISRNELEAIENGEETPLRHASGLGLWFAHWTAEASGGDLTFEVDDGTTARLTLQRVDEE